MNGDPFMELEDYRKAQQNRERYPVVRPDMRELTDDSKQLVRSLSAQQRKRNVSSKAVQQKFQPIYDPVTHRFKFH